jgi:aspartate kinase
MALIVQKYGGSSVADGDKIKSVARRVAKAKDEGSQVVVVVSAMGDTTDDLIRLARQVTEQPEDRELDVLLSTGEVVSSTLLAMALKSLGYEAVSLTGAQAGIQTDASYSRARILRVDPKRITNELEKGNIVIVAGFQGVTQNMDITTLGRGGSDTTAVALAAGLGAEICQIYTDVEGVYTADPRLVSEATKLQKIGYEEMLELASYGTKVIHPRAVELGELYDIPILVASSFSDSPGTIICKEAAMEVRNKVRGIAHDTNVAKITVIGVPDHPGIAAAIFEPLAKASISVDTIVQNASIENITDLSFTVARSDLNKAISIVEPVAKSVGAKQCVADSKLAKVSIVGTGMQNVPGYAARMFRALLVEHMFIAVGSVTIVLFLFLGWRAAIIVLLAIPLVILVVLGSDLLAGPTLNRISLYALILSLGVLVDDAIVVIENAHRHFMMLPKNITREDKARSVVLATNEIGNPTTLATFTVVVVFLSLFLVTGMLGQYFRPLTFNLPVAMIASLALAYSVTPWMIRRWLPVGNHQGDEAPARDWLQKGYRALFLPLVAHKKIRHAFYAVVGLLLVLSLLQPAWQFIRPQGVFGATSMLGVPLAFLPKADKNTFLVSLHMADNTPLEDTDRVVRDIEAIKPHGILPR